MRKAYFDSDGKCLIVQTGMIDPPPDAAFEAEVGDTDGPNTLEFDKAKGKPKRKERHMPAPVPRSGPSMKERLALLEAQVAALTGQ